MSPLTKESLIKEDCTKLPLNREIVIAMALLYFARGDYPGEEAPYANIAKELACSEFKREAVWVAEWERQVLVRMELG
jgi:hypothetical protein